MVLSVLWDMACESSHKKRAQVNGFYAAHCSEIFLYHIYLF